jgi:hypothetical protein
MGAGGSSRCGAEHRVGMIGYVPDHHLVAAQLRARPRLLAEHESGLLDLLDRGRLDGGTRRAAEMSASAWQPSIAA